MFDDKENLVGALFVLLCGAVGGVLVWEIVTGNRFHYTGPTWLTWVLGILLFGGIVYGLVLNAGRRSGGGPQWPDPNAGRKSWWDRLRGR